jgi:hypothetical protein
MKMARLPLPLGGRRGFPVSAVTEIVRVKGCIKLDLL